ncbi:unnamed protein product [Closterium sp. NIES-53]
MCLYGPTLFFALVYVDDLVFATAGKATLASVQSELQKRRACTDLGELRSYLGLQITMDRAARTINLNQSYIVQQVLQRFELQFSTTPPTLPPVYRKLTAALPDKPVEPSGHYAELVGCLIYLMMCSHLGLDYPLSILARFVVIGRHRLVHWTTPRRVAKYMATTSGMGLVLCGTQRVPLTEQCISFWADDEETSRSTQWYCFSLGSGDVSWSSSVAQSSPKAEIYRTMVPWLLKSSVG